MLLEFVLISEDDLSEGSAAAGIVHNVLDNSLDVSALKRALRVRHVLLSKLIDEALTRYAQRSRGF